jgi:hypothetical protein
MEHDEGADEFDVSDCTETALCGACNGYGFVGARASLRCLECGGSGEVHPVEDDGGELEADRREFMAELEMDR